MTTEAAALFASAEVLGFACGRARKGRQTLFKLKQKGRWECSTESARKKQLKCRIQDCSTAPHLQSS